MSHSFQEPVMHSIMRRSLLAGAAASLLLPLAGCGGDSDSDSATTSAAKYRLVQNGVIPAGTQAEQPPFAMTDASGNPTGFAVDLMNTAAQRLGLKVQYKTT